MTPVDNARKPFIASEAVLTRRRILNAAKQVFIDIGYEASTYALIARRAGVTRPMVNYYFPNKADLYRQVLEQTNTTLVRAAIAEAQGESTLSAQLRAFASAVIDAGSDGVSVAAFVATSGVELQRHRELQTPNSGVTEVHQFLVNAVEAAVRRGELARDTEVIATADLLSALFWGMGLYAGFVTGNDRLVAMVKQMDTLLQARTVATTT